MIENQQKTLSGPQDVLLGVPRNPQITQMAIQDAKMCLPKLTNIRLWCQKGGKPESRRVKDWGPAAEGEALKIRRARPWPAVGVVRRSPRKVPTFPEGNPGVFASAAGRSKITFFWHGQKILKMSQNCLPGGAQMEPEILKISKKCIPGAS